MSFGEESRMSHLKDHNIYLQTDQLYEPLRNALRKSSVSQYPISNELTNSRVGRNMRSLSPTQAELIKRSLLIPINKELVATRNVSKIMGKSFTAVDFSETVKQPLNAEQFSRVQLDATEEIIYQVKNGGTENSNIYTCRENIALLSSRISTSRFAGQSKIVAQPTSRKTLVKFVSPPTQSVRTNPNNTINQTNIYTQQVVKNQGYSFTIKPKQSNQNTPTKRPVRMDRLQHQNTPQLILQRQNSEYSINKSMTSIKALRNDTKTKQDASSQTRTIRNNKSQLYEFRTKNSDRATNRSHSRDRYRYNLSHTDEQGTAGCNRHGCCTNIQLFSSKASSNPWQ